MLEAYRQNEQNLKQLICVKHDEIQFDAVSANLERAKQLAKANTPDACEIRLFLIENFGVEFLSTLKATPKTDIEKLTLKEWQNEHKEIAVWQ